MHKCCFRLQQSAGGELIKHTILVWNTELSMAARGVQFDLDAVAHSSPRQHRLPPRPPPQALAAAAQTASSASHSSAETAPKPLAHTDWCRQGAGAAPRQPKILRRTCVPRASGQLPLTTCRNSCAVQTWVEHPPFIPRECSGSTVLLVLPAVGGRTPIDSSSASYWQKRCFRTYTKVNDSLKCDS